MQITITKPELFAAASYFKSDEETRYYLQGVYVHPSAEGGVNIVATNGHILFWGHDPEGSTNGGSHIIHCQKPYPFKYFSAKHLEITSDKIATWTGPRLNEIELAQEIEGSFPDYQRVIPHHALETEELSNYNSEYLGLIGKTAKYLKNDRSRSINLSSTFYLEQAGNGPARVWFYDRTDCMAVIMPVRRGEVTKAFPDGRTLIEPLKTVKKAA